MRKYVVGCCITLVVLTATGAEKSQPLCMDAKGRIGETQCLNQELERENYILSEYLHTAQKIIDKQNPAKPQIGEAEEMWIAYRNAQCKDVYTYWEAGTYRYRAELECEIEATRSRTHAIWSAYIRTFGTDIPLRPEP